jgi:hypothetical protein
VSVRVKRPRVEAPPEPPPMPPELTVYDPADWLPPGAPAEPADGHDLAAWAAFEDAHRNAYQCHLDARQAWYAEHGSQSIEAAIATPDAAFDPATDL